jgi:hypothetical protein
MGRKAEIIFCTLTNHRATTRIVLKIPVWEELSLPSNWPAVSQRRHGLAKGDG